MIESQRSGRAFSSKRLARSLESVCQFPAAGQPMVQTHSAKTSYLSSARIGGQPERICRNIWLQLFWLALDMREVVTQA